jgi:hypothetical protein
VPKRQKEVVDRYEWIVFGVLFPAMIAVIVVVLLLTGSTVIVFAIGTVMAVAGTPIRKSIAARLRARCRSGND